MQFDFDPFNTPNPSKVVNHTLIAAAVVLLIFLVISLAHKQLVVSPPTPPHQAVTQPASDPHLAQSQQIMDQLQQKRLAAATQNAQLQQVVDQLERQHTPATTQSQQLPVPGN